MEIDEQELIKQLKKKDNKTIRPLSEGEENNESKRQQKNSLTQTGGLGKNKKSKVGRKPTNNETVQFRCNKTNLDTLRKKIDRLNSKGLGLEINEVMALLVSHASHLTIPEFQEMVIAERLRS